MNDTQWPRYQVFLQEREDAPFQDVGSVHAPDPELALQNARDVFVRRPECVCLWVVPAEAIFTRTSEQLWAEKPDRIGIAISANEYAVFGKLKPAGTHVLQGQMSAATPALALRRALEQFPGLSNASSWMVLPLDQVTASDASDEASLFEPALNKPFRLPTNFQTVTAMRVIKLSESQSQSGSEEGGDGS
jgi:ring-1,2-phenylacetyl-CoA epoxidase subunit PaaB